MMDKANKKLECKNDANTASKKKVRPAQRLYVPPAQRIKKKMVNSNCDVDDAISSQQTSINLNIGAAEFHSKLEVSESNITNTEIEVNKSNELENRFCKQSPDTFKEEGRLTVKVSSNCTLSNSRQVSSNTDSTNCSDEIKQQTNSAQDQESLVIVLDNLRTGPDKNDVDVEQEEMERAIVNINRKTRPLIKHVNVGNNDVLLIDVDDKEIMINKPVRKTTKLVKKVDEQIANWEDLFNEDDEFNGDVMEQIVDYIGKNKTEELSEEEDCITHSRELSDLDHVIELFDFPSTLKTQDLIQLYHDVNEESMYIKWCDETHALLVLSTPAQAKRALQIEHDIIKSRSMFQASLIATQVALRCDLKPAMKRPQTNMQTARRLITTHLGTRSRLSKEEQQRESDELRKAKELKRALRQSENDAWDGHPRPSAV